MTSYHLRGKRLWLVLLIFSVGSGLAQAQTRILCFGDSITNGYLAGQGGANDGYLPYLSDYLNASWGPVTLINRGANGDTTLTAKARINTVLSQTTPNIVLVMIGTNDMSNIWSSGNFNGGLTQSASNVSVILDRISQFGAEAILATIIPRWNSASDPDNGLTKSYNNRLRSLASQRGLRLADQWQNYQSHLSGALYEDGLHPSQAGFALMAQEFAAVLAGVPSGSIDLVPPFTTSVQPKPGSLTAPATGPIAIAVREIGTGIDLSTLSMSVDGEVIEPVLGNSSPTSLLLTHSPASSWSFGQRVRVTLDLSDRANPVNSLSLNYSFTVSAGNGTLGDLDGSGRVDGADLVILAVAFGSQKGQSRYDRKADVDLNGVVDGSDLAYVASQFGSRL